MIDLLDTPTNYLDWRRIDEADTICGTVLKAKWAVLARGANARKTHARVLDYLPRAENSELTHLYVEAAVAHPDLGAYGPAVRATHQAVLLAPDVLNWLSNACPSGMPREQLSPSAGMKGTPSSSKTIMSKLVKGKRSMHHLMLVKPNMMPVSIQAPTSRCFALGGSRCCHSQPTPIMATLAQAQ